MIGIKLTSKPAATEDMLMPYSKQTPQETSTVDIEMCDSESNAQKVHTPWVSKVYFTTDSQNPAVNLQINLGNRKQAATATSG